MKTQVLIIHGGVTHKNKKDYLKYLKTKKVDTGKKVSWATDYLEKELGKTFEFIRPRMPCQDNANYNEWKILFERYLPLLKDNIILIGNSLGGIFLAKYLSENKFPRKILATFLVCPPYDNTIPSEDLVNGFKLKSNLTLIQKNCKNLYLMFSNDDPIIPISHANKYSKKLDKANILVYNNRGHFSVSKFPELIKIIKSLTINKK